MLYIKYLFIAISNVICYNMKEVMFMRKLITAAAALIICASLCINSFAAIAYGDVNGDNKINSTDALQALMHSTKLLTLKGNAKTAADVNADGTINATDALLILNYSVGAITKFPADSGGIEHDVF